MEHPEVTALQLNSHSIWRRLMSSSPLTMGQAWTNPESSLKMKAIGANEPSYVILKGSLLCAERVQPVLILCLQVMGTAQKTST